MAYLDTYFKDGISVVAVTVTPDAARKILNDHNTENRPVKAGIVKKYARIMKTGDWKFSPEAISISSNGRLLNGQHRLLAIEASGVTCKFLFATGFDDDVFDVLDRGATRTLSDAFGTEKKETECATMLARMSGSSSLSEVTDGDVRRALDCISDAHKQLMAWSSTATKTVSSAPFRLAAIARVMAGADREYVFNLYRNLVLGRTEDLPPVGHATIRAVHKGRLKAYGGQVQAMNACAAWDVFNPASRNKSRIVVKYDGCVVKEIVEACGYERA